MVPTTPSAVVSSPSRVSARHLLFGARADCFSHVRSISAFTRVLNRTPCLCRTGPMQTDVREVPCAPSSEQGGSAQPLDQVQLDLRPSPGVAVGRTRGALSIRTVWCIGLWPLRAGGLAWPGLAGPGQ